MQMKKIYGWDYYCERILRKSQLFIENSLAEKEKSYIVFDINDRGRERTICQVDKTSGLYQLQNNLNRNLLAKIPLSKAASGFVRGLSYQDYLRPHCGKRFHMRLDIYHFFDHVTEEQVVKSLEEFVQDEKIRENIGEITTLNGKLPQGAVTSPAVSNIVFRRIDQRILKYCQSVRKVREGKKFYQEDLIYTRYADDMMVSSDYLDFRRDLFVYRMIKHILKENGFSLNTEKTYMAAGEISLSGFVVGGKENGCSVRPSRKRLREINRILAYFDARREPDGCPYEVEIKKLRDPRVLDHVNQLYSDGSIARFSNKKSLINYLCGYRAFLITFLKGDQGQDSSRRALQGKIRNLEKLIDQCQRWWFDIE